jgi:hypothetical protein
MLRNLAIIPATESWSELLEWVNSSMPVEAPNHNKTPAMRKVEECGHGVPYVLMLPSMLPIIHTPLLTSRVKVPAKTDYEAVANLKIMQDALRRNGIVVPDVLANDQQKLIGRNFQANLQLLQWFRGLYVALQQCGIEAGEGRIILEQPSNENSVASLGIPPPSVVRAEGRRRAESIRRTKPESDILREVRAVGSQGDAAAAAAVALLSEHRCHSHNGSPSRNSQLEASVLNSSHSASFPVHHQQLPEKMPPPQPRKQSQKHSSISRSRREEAAPLDSSLAKHLELSPLPVPPLTESRASAIPPPPLPQPATKPAKMHAAPARTSSLSQRAAAQQASAAWPHSETRPATEAAATTAGQTHIDLAESAKPAAAPHVALHRRSSATRRPSSPLAAAPPAANAATNRTPRRAESAATNTCARTPMSSRSGMVFKPIPARLSAASSARRRASGKSSGGTPRLTEAAPSVNQTGTGSRKSSTPKRTSAAAASDNNNNNGAPRQPARLPSKNAAKPVIALTSTTTVVPAAQTQHMATVTTSAPPPSSPEPMVPTTTTTTTTTTNHCNAAETPAPAANTAPFPGQQAAEPDVHQLQMDRQFFYDKLRAIEELVDCMEAKKKQQREANAAAWDGKDEELMDFTNSVRSVLYAES